MVKFKIYAFFITILAMTAFSCRTKESKNEEIIIELKKGLNYKVPEGMEETPDEARKYSYRNFIIQKNTSYSESGIIIAVREANNINDYSIDIFAESDQAMLKKQVNITYLKEWTAPGLIEKKIESVSYQFYYNYRGDTIVQRSVYIKYNKLIYIISMSSKEYEKLSDKKNDLFWESIFLVY